MINNTYSAAIPSSKYSDFVNEPMGFKHISHVPGINEEYSDLLIELGYDKVTIFNIQKNLSIRYILLQGFCAFWTIFGF